MFIQGEWIEEIRYYQHEKDLNSFDLFPIEPKKGVVGGRRNAKLVK